MASPVSGAEPPRERPKLKLKPRDEEAAQRAAIERASSGKSVSAVEWTLAVTMKEQRNLMGATYHAESVWSSKTQRGRLGNSCWKERGRNLEGGSLEGETCGKPTSDGQDRLYL